MKQIKELKQQLQHRWEWQWVASLEWWTQWPQMEQKSWGQWCSRKDFLFSTLLLTERGSPWATEGDFDEILPALSLTQGHLVDTWLSLPGVPESVTGQADGTDAKRAPNLLLGKWRSSKTGVCIGGGDCWKYGRPAHWRWVSRRGTAAVRHADTRRG